MNDNMLNAINTGSSLFPLFESTVRKKSPGKPTREWVKRDALNIESVSVLPLGARKPKVVEVFYLPFEHINLKARIVLVGMSPGNKQMMEVAETVSEQLSRFNEIDLQEIKKRGAFAGIKMRSNLTRMLNYYDIPSLIGVASGEALFGSRWESLQTTSILRYPVFVDGKDYTGQIDMLDNKVLRKYVVNYFCREIAALDNPYIIPLGDEAADALNRLVKEGLVSGERVIDRFRHPSPEAGSRVGYVIEQVARCDLDPDDPVIKCVDKYDAERSRVKTRVAALRYQSKDAMVVDLRTKPERARSSIVEGVQ